MIARTPPAPYYLVAFTSQRTDGDLGYADAAERMVELAREQPGFLGLESVRGEDGLGITLSYWRDEAAILAWRAHAEHSVARDKGRALWYSSLKTRVARVERDYGFGDEEIRKYPESHLRSQ